MRACTYRFAGAVSALLVFLAMCCLYRYGDRYLYELVLRAYGVAPFRFPFVDISGSLAAWECTRQGVDVVLSDPCDVLHRGYSYSPLWLAASSIPLDVGDTTVVGWSLDLLFILALCLVPPPRRPLELALVLAATLSTMVVFALERANPDILLFILALATGFLAGCGPFGRLIGYSVGLVSALLKYYPIVTLIIVFRERMSLFLAVGLIIVVSLAVFWAEYHAEIAIGLPTIPQGPYNTDLFAAKNLPFLLGAAAGSAAEPSASALLVRGLVAGGVYSALVGGCLAICRRLLGFAELRVALASLTRPERVLLVIGSAVIIGCFFAGQSIGYRGVFLLLVMPGLLAISREAGRNLPNLGLATSVVIVLLMWGECFRLALDRALEHPGIPAILSSQLKIIFWFVRELGWWWTVSVMLAVVADFLRECPIVHRASSLFDRLAVRSRELILPTGR